MDDPDPASAEQVISDYGMIAAMGTRAEESTITLLALQQPVAGELRSINSWVHAVADVDQMGRWPYMWPKLSGSDILSTCFPQRAMGYFAEMGRVAVESANAAQDALITRDPGKAARIREQDDAMDELHRQLFTVLMDHKWKHGVPAAVDAALLGRFYERSPDHAVEVGRRVVFQVTGNLPEQEVGTYYARKLPG